MTVTTHRRASSMLIVLVVAFAFLAATVANAAPATPAQVAQRGGCIQDTSTHEKRVPGHPIHLVNKIHFKWCPGRGTVTNSWAQVTVRSTNGKPLRCAGVWTRFYASDKSGVTQGHKKVHVECNGRTSTHRAPINDGKHYKVRGQAWPVWTGYNQVAYNGAPQSFVWIRGQLNPFEIGHRLPLVVRVLVGAAHADRVAGQVASIT